MKPVLLLLLAAAVGCSADFITIRSQPMPQSSGLQGPRLYVVNSQNEDAAPRVLGLLSRLQMQPQAGAMQDLASPFSTILSGRASSFFDTSLTGWMDQQMAALDQLQAQLGPPPVLTSGCPRLAAMRAAAAAGAASLPQDAVSYLAASRFGPGLLATFPQQGRDAPIDADWQLTGADVGEEDDGFVDDEDDDDAAADVDDGEDLNFDAGGLGVYFVNGGPQRRAAPNQQGGPMMLTASGVGLANPMGRGFMPSMLSEDDSMALYPAAGVADSVELADGEDDGPTWFFVLQDGSMNWGLICFLALALAVIPLWFWNIRALVRLLAGVPSSPGSSCPRCPFARFKAARQQAAAQQGQFLAAAKAPLLAEYLVPLAPEKPVAEKPAPEILTSVEVASEQTPHGEYVAPSNNQFVTVRYVPLKGEEV